mgnify:FL=1
MGVFLYLNKKFMPIVIQGRAMVDFCFGRRYPYRELEAVTHILRDDL